MNNWNTYKKEDRTENKYSHRFLLTFICVCYLYYLVVRGSGGYFYFPANSKVVVFSIGGNTFATIILYLGFLLTIALGLIEYRKNMSFRYFAYAFLITIPILFWIFIDLNNYSLRSILSITTINPFTFLMLIAVYIGMNPKAWNYILHLCVIISPVLIMIAAFYSVHFLSVYGAKSISNSPQIIYLSAGFWPLSVRALCNNERKKDSFTVILIIVSLICSILYNSRGWIIQCIILIIIYTFFKNKIRSVSRIIVIIISIITLIVIAYFLAKYYMPDRIISLMEKFDTGVTSRQWQYDTLFSQYSFTDILLGKGSFATYDTEVYGTYMYFDNAFINIMLKYGILPAVLFLIVLLRATVKLLRSKQTYRNKGPAYILLLFFLAIMGFSVFCVVSIDLKFLIICVLIGRCDYICRYGEKLNVINEGSSHV